MRALVHISPLRFELWVLWVRKRNWKTGEVKEKGIKNRSKEPRVGPKDYELKGRKGGKRGLRVGEEGEKRRQKERGRG